MPPTATTTPNSFFLHGEKWHEIQLGEMANTIKGNPSWLKDLEDLHQRKIYGGYLEDRSPLFDERHISASSIHVGIDFWMPEGTLITFPFQGQVVFTMPATPTPGGWGGRIDIEAHNLIWILGHLQSTLWTKGDTIQKDQILGKLAPRKENGGWLPHLHIQCMQKKEYLLHKDPSQIDAYSRPQPNLKEIFPNPLF